jgi:hypothetical protein
MSCSSSQQHESLQQQGHAVHVVWKQQHWHPLYRLRQQSKQSHSQHSCAVTLPCECASVQQSQQLAQIGWSHCGPQNKHSLHRLVWQRQHMSQQRSLSSPQALHHWISKTQHTWPTRMNGRHAHALYDGLSCLFPAAPYSVHGRSEGGEFSSASVGRRS